MKPVFDGSLFTGLIDKGSYPAILTDVQDRFIDGVTYTVVRWTIDSGPFKGKEVSKFYAFEHTDLARRERDGLEMKKLVRDLTGTVIIMSWSSILKKRVEIVIDHRENKKTLEKSHYISRYSVKGAYPSVHSEIGSGGSHV